jgi:RHS repeat-associated protein
MGHPAVQENYQYDAIGQLTEDVSMGQTYEWTISDRKLKTLNYQDENGITQQIDYVYNPFGQRLIKINKKNDGSGNYPEADWIYSYYAYDANGQVMAIYSAEISSSNNTARLSEKMILGQSRIGILKPESDEQALLYDNGLVAVNNDGYSNSWYGQTQYEITNYLGNVNAVISDKRISLITSVGSEVEILMKSDYYPFGMPMADRQSNSESYRYAYNGMESDGEVSGSGNSYTTEFRQYDPRLARWKSLDPLMMKFPWMSPYVAFDNNPVFYTDPFGLEATNDGGDEDLFENDPNAPMGSEGAQRPVDRPHTDVSAPQGYSKEKAVGGQDVYLEDNGSVYRSKTSNQKLGYEKGTVISFESNGRKYNASWDENHQFRGYYSGSKQYYPKFNIEGKTFAANSLKTLAGRDDGFNNTGDFNGIVQIEDAHMQTMLAYGTLVFHIWNWHSIEQTVKAESVGGLLDFKDAFYEYYGFDKQTLVRYKGIVYNSNEIGNLIWAMVLDYHGILVNPNTIAEFGTSGRHDEAWEQAAISRGKLISRRLRTQETKNKIKAIIPILREEFQR